MGSGRMESEGLMEKGGDGPGLGAGARRVGAVGHHTAAALFAAHRRCFR